MRRSNLVLSPLDEQRWGVRTARGEIEHASEVDAAEAFAREMHVALVILRISTRQMGVAQGLEGRGYS